MKARIRNLFVALTLLTLNPQLSTAFAQGSLAPPGPPALTMKSLDQIEPRIPVNSLPGDSDNVFVISRPGSYYLTANIIVTDDFSGLSIVTNDVVVDLNGFTLYGPGARTAIHTFGPNVGRIRIRNGHLSGWANGVDLYSNGTATNTVLEDLQINVAAASFTYGIASGDSARISRCSISGAAGDSSYGILTGNRSVIDSCEIANCAFGVALGEWCAIKNCIIQQCTATGADGIQAGDDSAVQNNLVDGCYEGITLNDSCIATDNRVENSTVGSGLIIDGNGSRVENNIATGNAQSGFNLSFGTNNLIIKNFARGNHSGNFSLDNNQVAGPVINTTGTITTSNPWANFSY